MMIEFNYFLNKKLKQKIKAEQIELKHFLAQKVRSVVKN